MHIDDLFIFTTAQLLKKSNETFESVKTDLQDLFGGYEFNIPKKVKAFSITATNSDQKYVGYWDWIHELRNGGFTKATIENLNGQGVLPDPIAAAFANGISRVFKISSTSKVRTYIPMNRSSRQTWLDGHELEFLIDAQSSDQETRRALWQSILEADINRFGSYDQAKTIEEARNFLHKDYENYFCPANDILRTLQHYCAREGLEFKIPAHLTHKLEKPISTNIAENSYAPYIKEELSGKEVGELIAAQNSELIWSKVKESLAENIKTQQLKFENFSVTMNNDSLIEFIKSLTSDEIYQLSLTSCTYLFGENFVIPEQLKHKFNFPELPPIPDHQLWRATPNNEPWQMLCFEFAGEINFTNVSPPEEFNWPKLMEQFHKTLVPMESFAKKVESPFAEAFSVAAWVLTAQNLNFQNRNEFMAAAASENFSENALQVLDHKLNFGLNKALQLSTEQVRLILALDLVNIFGGMGSWNDQNFLDPSDQLLFETLTAELFSAIQKLKEAMSRS